MLGTRLEVTPYERRHRSALLDLDTKSPWTHKHLDWYSIGQWLDQERGQVFLAWEESRLVGCIGLSLPIEGNSWIRLLCIGDGRMPGLIVEELWERAEAQCRRCGIHSAAILMVTNWLATYLRQLGFEYADDVITMNHIGCRLPKAPAIAAIIRRAEADDIARIAEIDHLAFPPRWRMAHADIWQAIRISAPASVAVHERDVVAYQFSTRHDGVGHLARLAVEPAYQRRGIGSLVLHQLLSELSRQPAQTISVNTQLSNAPSQQLYQRFGFFRDGNDLEMWHKGIA